jgi:hypothetical protein
MAMVEELDSGFWILGKEILVHFGPLSLTPSEGSDCRVSPEDSTEFAIYPSTPSHIRLLPLFWLLFDSSFEKLRAA